MSYTHEAREHKDKRPRTPAVMPPICDQKGAWDAFHRYLQERGLSSSVAMVNGWYPSLEAGDREKRIVMPATNSSGIAYWQARAIEKEAEPRYQSPPVPRGDSVIQMWPENKEHCPLTIICEGPMDALAAAGHGVRSIALMGNTPTEETLDSVCVMLDETDIVTYFTDRDSLTQSMELVKRLMKRGVVCTISDPTPYKDLAAMPLKVRAGIIAHYVEHCTSATLVRGATGKYNYQPKKGTR